MWAELGEGWGGEVVGLGASVQLCLSGAFQLLFLLGSHSMTAKDVPLTAPMKDCRAREEATGGSHVPALG